MKYSTEARSAKQSQPEVEGIQQKQKLCSVAGQLSVNPGLMAAVAESIARGRAPDPSPAIESYTQKPTRKNTNSNTKPYTANQN